MDAIVPDPIETLSDLTLFERAELPASTLALARMSLLDWIACGLAARGEPLARKLRNLAEQEGGNPAASIFGGGAAPARMAALVNGATSHALDYDDTHFAHVGHLSVAIYPAAFAIGEETDQGAEAVVEAFLAGAETAIRIGIGLGRKHYDNGFHQTATAGAFGATLAAGRLLALDRDQIRNAIGLCATRASGLKSQFGTMGKPYNAGIAASNGVECARLAALGMTSADDGLLGQQGFFATHAAESINPDFALQASGRFLFEDNKYKLHACCHGTHAMIEALLNSAEMKGKSLEEVVAFELATNPRWLSVCDIKSPRTGLEVKFSYNWLAGMALRGDDTANDRIFTDNLARDSELAEFAGKMSVEGDETLTDLQARGTVKLSDGSTAAIWHDLADPVPQTELTAKLRKKAVAMLGETGDRLWELFGDLEGKSARELGRFLRAP